MKEIKEVTDCINNYTILAKKCEAIIDSTGHSHPKIAK